MLAEENKIDFFNNKDILVSVDKNNDTYSYLLSLLSSFKDERIRQVYELRYFSGGEKLATWNSIAKKLGVSTQTAINLHEKTRSFLKNKVQSKNSCDFV
jgi:DNA-directed RNA polymerase specialized sigma subunit